MKDFVSAFAYPQFRPQAAFVVIDPVSRMPFVLGFGWDASSVKKAIAVIVEVLDSLPIKK